MRVVSTNLKINFTVVQSFFLTTKINSFEIKLKEKCFKIPNDMYRDNQKTVYQEDDIKAVTNSI